MHTLIIATGPFTGRGVWSVQLKPIGHGDGGGPYTITASLGGQNPIKISDVLFGDVWVCSGQSNMVFSVQQVCSYWVST